MHNLYDAVSVWPCELNAAWTCDGWESGKPQKVQLIKIRNSFLVCHVFVLSPLHCYVTAWSQQNRVTIKWMKPPAAAMTLLVFCHSLVSLLGIVWWESEFFVCVFCVWRNALLLCWFIYLRRWCTGAINQ